MRKEKEGASVSTLVVAATCVSGDFTLQNSLFSVIKVWALDASSGGVRCSGWEAPAMLLQVPEGYYGLYRI